MRKRTDANHREIMNTLRSLGCEVIDTSMVPRFCDMVVRVMPGMVFLVEAKRDSKAKLKPSQVELKETWRLDWVRINSSDEALEFVRAQRASWNRLKGAA